MTDEQNGKSQVGGVVEHIIYQNEENGYTVCEVGSFDDELVTLVGNMPYLGVGETIKAIGCWIHHPSFGRQFKVEYYEKELPASESAILKYLSAGTVKGIGPSTALKIVGQFGTDSFDVIENHPEWLADIPGISAKKAKIMSDDFKMQFGLRSVMMFCRDYFGPQTAVKIYKKWGGGAIDIIKKNPYILCDEISGIGFEKADAIAMSLGGENYKHERLCAGIKYILSFNARQNGHVFIPRDKLTTSAASMLSSTEELTENAIDELIQSNQLVEATYENRKCIYSEYYFSAEKYATEKLILLDRACPALDGEDSAKIIDKIETEFGVKYANLQRKAISNSMRNGVMILTGGPGTGKTTVIRALIRIFENLDFKIALAAPTGRAAKRMSESTFCEAKTIHRLLEMDYGGDEKPVFRRNEKMLLEENVIIVDETSMVDTLLFSALLKAIKPGARLILIGDADQLPSVGAGNVLNDLIRSDMFNTVELKEVFRQEEQSLIVTNAHAINEGEYPELTSKNNDFFFLPRETDEDIRKTVAQLYAYRLPKTYGKDTIKSIQVITPSKKGIAGTENLNVTLQSIINPPSPKKREKKLMERVFREGDKVMQVKNNYNLLWTSNEKEGTGVFNGVIGIISYIDNDNETLTVIFDEERETIYEFSMLDELELAYAVTVHKSQGSEYPFVIIPMYNFSLQLRTRNLLYTAVTRAQKMVILVGRAEIIKQMVDTDRPTKRYTGLEYLLKNYVS